MSAYNLVSSGRNFTLFFLFNAELIVFDNAVYPLSMSLLHFKPIFDTPLKKIVSEVPVPGGGCATKTWSFSSACKNLGAQHPLGTEI